MGFKDIKARILTELSNENGSINHVERKRGKNLLKDESITIKEVMTIINKCQGTAYKEEPHHSIPGVKVQVMKTIIGEKKWYIKFYFVADKIYFESIHF